MVARAAALRRDPWLVTVVLAGLLVRAALIPITHGQDFVVWDKASAATLRGVDIYRHHPGYPHGPFAYFPLFVYVEMPFQWIAQHAHISFVIMGKLAILAADVACALLISAELRRRGVAAGPRALGVALWFLNPLVLYNSAFYGRFDSVGCALLLLAIRSAELRRGFSRAGAVWYGLAIAAKTFPAFVLAGVLRRAGRSWARALGVAAGVVLALSLPYVTSARPFVRDIVFYDAGEPPGGLSWQHVVLPVLGAGDAKLVSYGLLVVFAAATVWLTRVQDLARYTVLVLVLFVLTSKVVLEQYLTWPLPWLIVLSVTRSEGSSAAKSPAPKPSAPTSLESGRDGRWPARWLIALFTVIGMIESESVHPFGRPSDALNVVLAAGCVAYLWTVLGRSVAPRLR